MSRDHRRIVTSAIGLVLIAVVGCGGSEADLDEAYGLSDPSYKSNPAAPVVDLAKELQRTLRSREVSPQMAVSNAAENFASYSKESFGGYEKEYDELKETMSEMSSYMETSGSSSEIRELAQQFQDQAKALEDKIDSAGEE